MEIQYDHLGIGSRSTTGSCFDKIFKAKDFHWSSQPLTVQFIFKLKQIIMKPFMKKIAAFIILAAMISHEAAAFCGFYVSKADGTLKNKTSR